MHASSACSSKTIASPSRPSRDQRAARRPAVRGRLAGRAFPIFTPLSRHPAVGVRVFGIRVFPLISLIDACNRDGREIKCVQCSSAMAGPDAAAVPGSQLRARPGANVVGDRSAAPPARQLRLRPAAASPARLLRAPPSANIGGDPPVAPPGPRARDVQHPGGVGADALASDHDGDGDAVDIDDDEDPGAAYSGDDEDPDAVDGADEEDAAAAAGGGGPKKRNFRPKSQRRSNGYTWHFNKRVELIT